MSWLTSILGEALVQGLLKAFLGWVDTIKRDEQLRQQTKKAEKNESVAKKAALDSVRESNSGGLLNDDGFKRD